MWLQGNGYPQSLYLPLPTFLVIVKEIEQVLDEGGKIKWSKVFEEVESGDLIKRRIRAIT
jgi:hypothetical protein